MICEVFGRYPISVESRLNGRQLTVLFHYESYDAVGIFTENSSKYYLARFAENGDNGGTVNVSSEWCEEEFRALGCEVIVTTVDGSYGVKGFVTNAFDGQQSFYYTCGPLPMIKAVLNALGTEGEVSMEERMGCGFGACMGCTIQTTKGPKRVCKEGPVFDANELMIE